MTPLIRMVDVAQAIPYPISRSERLESHWFLQWERRRWLNSDMRLRGTPECRAHYFDLICIAVDHSPVGTLPNDLDLIAKLLMVEAGHFKMLCAMPFGPLHKWQAFDCEGEIRLGHETLVEVLMEAISRKEDNRARTDAANVSKRRQRIRLELAKIAPDLVANDRAVLFLDQWFEDQGIRKRTADKFRAGLSAFVEASRSRGGRAL
jgi:hypothetical protein